MDNIFKTLLAANNKLNNVCKSLVGLDNLREKKYPVWVNSCMFCCKLGEYGGRE